MALEDAQVHLHDPQLSWNPYVPVNKQSTAAPQSSKSLFEIPRSLASSDGKCTLLISLHPHFPKRSIHDASRFLGINDLLPALGDFLSSHSYINRNGQRLATFNCHLTFSSLNAWKKFCIQLCSAQNPISFSPPQTIQAEPPSDSLPFGRANMVLLSHESSERACPHFLIHSQS